MFPVATAARARLQIVDLLTSYRSRPAALVSAVSALCSTWSLPTINAASFGFFDRAAGAADVVATAGSAAITSASNPWTSADVGKSIAIAGAGAAAAALAGVIVAVTAPGAVTLDRTASTNQAATVALWGNDVVAESDPGLVTNAGTAATGVLVTARGGSTARTPGAIAADVVNVKDYGAKGDGVTDDAPAFKEAIAAMSAGSVLFVPATSAFYSISTAGGLTAAVVIDKAIEVRIDGVIKATFSAIQANPPYIFNVTADGVTFSGRGKIKGDGAIDSTNSGDDTTMPGLVRVTGDNFSMAGLTIDTPPKIGVLLYSCANAKISDCVFTGGPLTYTSTGYFAIRGYLGSGHNVNGNLFTPAANGGMFVNTIFCNGTNKSAFIGNICIRPYEKFVYLYGNDNLISDNYVVGSTDVIPGTAQAGTITSVYRCNGNQNKITNNVARYVLAGCTVMDGYGNEISGNSFIDCGQVGIAIFPNVGYAGNFSGTVIANNVMSGAAITGIVLDAGISVALDYANSENILITGNRITSFDGGAAGGVIGLSVANPYSLEKCKISGNRIDGAAIGRNGVRVSRVVDSLVSDNFIQNCTLYGLAENAGARNSWLGNKCLTVGSPGINGLDTATANCHQNQYTNKALIGTFTCSAAITTTVTHGGVAPNARVFLQTANDAAGVMIVAKGWPTTGISGADFTARMANGTPAGGTESFFYHIVQ